MKKQQVIIITTGGTIEKTYDESSGILSNRGSQLKTMLKRLRLPYTSIQHRDLLSKDSLEMTQEDRLILLHEVKILLEKNIPIIILHGTDTMEQTANLLYINLKPSVPIILTGAMRPFGFENSDALQNFTEALYASSIIQTGIYISMHGKLHNMPGIVKDRKKGTFKKKRSSK